MGAKAPSKLKLRRPTYKCHQCSKNFLSTQALKSHMYCVHKIKGNGRPVREKAKLTNLLGKSVKNQNVTMAKTVKQPVEVDVEKSVTLDDQQYRRIEFECPQCLKMFAVYISAFKHIQKFHCINEKGQRVSSNSSDIIKPLRVELCTKCNRRVRNNELHKCSEATVDSNLVAITCVCTGCKQQFASIQLFDLHVTGLHCDKIESMFFPTMSEFFHWKNDMESETSNRYLILNKCNSKQTFRCTSFLATDKDNDEEVTHFCPSSIIVREYSKGIQVHFYKQHYGHPSPEYSVSKQFSKYAITSLMEKKTKSQLDVVDMSDDSDLYVQFKTLMDNIVLDAAKLKINHLKILIGKALEMSTILKQYNGDEDFDESQKPTQSNKTMTDDEITTALESFTKDIRKRRKILGKGVPVKDTAMTSKVSPIVAVKRQKVETPIFDISKAKRDISIAITPIKTYSNKSKGSKTPVILNTFSLAEEEDKDKPLPTKVKEEPPIDLPKETEPAKAKTMIVSPVSLPTFNDSYRQFVDKNFTSKIDKQPDVKNAQMITKPNNTDKIKVLSKNDINERVELRLPIEINTNNNVNTKSFEKVDKSNIITDNSVTNTINKSNDVNKSVSFSKTKSNNIRKNTPIKKAKVDKKKVMKTKIGQFKPSLSPKKPEPIKETRNSINNRNSKSKLDFEYEVKEQENDCNILILKI